MTKRQYVSNSDIEQFSNIQVTDVTEAEDQITQAEEMVDSYVGFQEKHITGIYSGLATSGGADYLVDTSSDSPLKIFYDDYFTYCVVEIIGGTGKGQTSPVVSSDQSSNKIFVNGFSISPDNTSFYVIRQLGKFPRDCDAFIEGYKYYKSIPEAVKRATLAQIEYLIEKGSDFFSGAVDYESETLEGYSYNLKKGKARFMSPTARNLLKGIMNIKGRMIA